jgi:large subunit ribosomal protein L9
MKVILLQNVPELGQKDDVKEVKVGYWRNFLLARDLAVAATPDLIEQAKKRREEQLKQKEVGEEKLAGILKELKDQVLTIEAKADEKGNLFAGIDAKKITEAVKEKLNFEIPVDAIKLEKPIKKIGPYEIPVKDITLKVEVISD